MAISDILTIKKLSDSNNTYCFDCAGSIDVNAKIPLETLLIVPAKARVILEFKKIERVNSMGLSLLLKIFEEWEKKQIIIEVKDLNRMVNMLFKITGLGRFIQGGNDITKTGEKNTINPQAPIHANANKSAEGLSKKSHIKKKLNFVASLQTGQQLTGWYLFNTYLQRRMQKAMA
jgi:anti-anti-sigma factor